MKYLLMLLLLCGTAYGQSNLYLRADSIRLLREGGNAELILMNGTRATTGVLVNWGNGRTRFYKPRFSGDTLFIGVDTLIVPGGSTGWKITGNSGLNQNTNFLGTTDDIPLRFKTNGQNSGLVGNKGSTYFGYQTGMDADSLGGSGGATGYRNVGIGFQVLRNTGANTAFAGASVAVGFEAASASTGGSSNVFVGFRAGKYADSAYRNVFVGLNAAYSITSGEKNTGVGTFAGESITQGDFNVLIGEGAGRKTTDGSLNVASGNNANFSSTTWVDTVLITAGGSGYTSATATISAPHALPFGWPFGTGQATATVELSGGAVIAVHMTSKGERYSLIDNPTVTISGDGTGATAVAQLTSGVSNTAIGTAALFNNSNGTGNTAIGNGAGYGSAADNKASYIDHYNTFIGFEATRDSTIPYWTAIHRSTAIGWNARVGQSNSTSIGAVGNGHKVGIGTYTPDSTLHVVGGLRLVTGAQGLGKTLISNATGGADWSTGNSYFWKVGGNTLASGIGQFFGTTDNRTVRFRTNDIERGTLDSNGRFTITSSTYASIIGIFRSITTGIATPVLAVSATATGKTVRTAISATSSTMGDTTLLNALYFGLNENPRNSGFLSFQFFGNSSTSNYISMAVNGSADQQTWHSDFSSRFKGYLRLADISTPATPDAGNGSVYVNGDSLRFINDAGTVFTLGTSSGGGGGITGLTVGSGGTTITSGTAGRLLLQSQAGGLLWQVANLSYDSATLLTKIGGTFGSPLGFASNDIGLSVTRGQTWHNTGGSLQAYLSAGDGLSGHSRFVLRNASVSDGIKFDAGGPSFIENKLAVGSTGTADSTLLITGGLRINNGAAKAGYVWTANNVDGRATWKPPVTYVASGTYTPTVTNTTNITSSTPNPFQYLSITDPTSGEQDVSFSGSVLITNTLAVASEFQITLPIASGFGAATEGNGVGNSDAALATNVIVKADATTDRLSITFSSISVGATAIIYISGHYKVTPP